MAKRPKSGTWDQLKIHPAKLTKMVAEGKARIVGSMFGKNIYELVEEESGEKK